MIEYKDTNYGADADGNRGITIWEYEIEDEDFEEIKEQISTQLWEDCIPYTSTTTIYLESQSTGEKIDFEVEVSEYLTQEEYNKIMEEIDE